MSVSNQAKRQGKILDEMMAFHREQLPKTMRTVPLADLRAFAAVAPAPRPITPAFQGGGVALVMEGKKASPEKGLLNLRYNAVALAKDVIAAGATAVSIWTDARHYQGSIADLRDVKESVSVPVIRQDFIFHPYQLYESLVAGADGVVLITAVLKDSELHRLSKKCRQLGMEPIIEVHTPDDMDRALAVNPAIILINRREWQTFNLDERAVRLGSFAPDGVTVLLRGGVRTAVDFEMLADNGIDGALVGQALCKNKNPRRLAQELVYAGR